MNGCFCLRYGRVPPAIKKQAIEFWNIFYDCRMESDPSEKLGLLHHTAMDLIPY